MMVIVQTTKGFIYKCDDDCDDDNDDNVNDSK